MTGGRRDIGAAARELGVVEWIRPDEAHRVPAILERIERLGVRRLRTGVSWADYHLPDGADWYAWLLPELARRVEVLPCFHYVPPTLGVVPKTSAPPRDPKAFADFLDVFVNRHGDAFEWVELWNEPTNLLDWDWRLDPEWRIFCEMVGGAAYWMRHLGKKVLLGGNCPTDLNWLAHVGRGGVLEYVDAVGLHAFPGTWSIDWAGWDEELATVRACLDALGSPRPLWITEAGFSTWRHDEGRQARELVAALRTDADRVYWYALDDLATHVETQQGFHVDERHYHFGIYRQDGTPKLAARALETGGGARLAEVVELAAPRIHTAAPRVVVTGGAGFLGSNLVDSLASDGHDVLVLDSLARPGVEENLEWLASRHRHAVAAEVADVRDPHVADDLVRGASAVVHLAAQVAVTTSIVDPVADFEVNARGTLNVLEAVRRRAPEAPVLFASTNKVYGELLPWEAIVREGERYLPREPSRRQGADEDTPLSLHSPYGCSKGLADQYALDYARVFGLRTAVFRMSCLYGPRQFGTEDQGWVAHFVLAALSGRPITIFGDGYQVRDLLYVEDAVSAWRAALADPPRVAGRAFNLGGGPHNARSLREILAAIPEFTGARPDIRFADWRPGDQAWYVSDTSAFTAATGWRPTIPVAEGLRRLTAWLALIAPAAPDTEELRA